MYLSRTFGIPGPCWVAAGRVDGASAGYSEGSWRTGSPLRAAGPGHELRPFLDADVRVLRQDRLGGLIRDYAQVADGDRVPAPTGLS